jgi:hypothetical protein
LEEKAAKEGIVYTEAQLSGLEVAKREKVKHPDEKLRQEHRGSFRQDTFYCRILKRGGEDLSTRALTPIPTVGLQRYTTVRKLPVKACDNFERPAFVPFFEEQGIAILIILKAFVGQEFCGLRQI